MQIYIKNKGRVKAIHDPYKLGNLYIVKILDKLIDKDHCWLILRL